MSNSDSNVEPSADDQHDGPSDPRDVDELADLVRQGLAHVEKKIKVMAEMVILAEVGGHYIEIQGPPRKCMPWQPMDLFATRLRARSVPHSGVCPAHEKNAVQL